MRAMKNFAIMQEAAKEVFLTFWRRILFYKNIAFDSCRLCLWHTGQSMEVKVTFHRLVFLSLQEQQVSSMRTRSGSFRVLEEIVEHSDSSSAPPEALKVTQPFLKDDVLSEVINVGSSTIQAFCAVYCRSEMWLALLGLVEISSGALDLDFVSDFSNMITLID